MIECGAFYDALARRGVDFFTGVPDSLLKDFCGYLSEHCEPGRHIAAANEGAAVALACGHHLATGKTALVYMQNSGQGNALNPLVSLADPEVYGIPVLLLIGWRGEPGRGDEPQHRKQGRITLDLLEVMGVAYRLLPDDIEAAEQCLDEVIGIMERTGGPAALVVRKGLFEPYRPPRPDAERLELSRETAIGAVVDGLGPSDIVVSTTGKISRELYEHRKRQGHDSRTDFLTIGSMGHCSQIAMGVALAKPQRQVFCLDGDGAVLMHMGALATIGSVAPANFKHIVLNNGCHDSVGGQPTCGFAVSITGIAKACGYRLAVQARTIEQVNKAVETVRSSDGPAMLEVMVRSGARPELGRPKSAPSERKNEFMSFLAQ